MTVRAKLAHKKSCFFERLWDRHAIIGLQEVHGSRARFLAAFPVLSRNYFVTSSFGTDAAAGGLVTLLPRFGRTSNDIFNSSDLGCPGRVVRTWFVGDGSAFFHYNIHLEDLSEVQVMEIAKFISLDRKFCAESPLERILCMYQKYILKKR